MKPWKRSFARNKGWTFHGAIPEPAPNRGKNPGKRGRLTDNRSPRERSGSSEYENESQVAKNKGFVSINPLAAQMCQTFCRPNLVQMREVSSVSTRGEVRATQNVLTSRASPLTIVRAMVCT